VNSKFIPGAPFFVASPEEETRVICKKKECSGTTRNTLEMKAVKEYTHVHDNEILSYSVDFNNKELRFSTKYYDMESTLIVFNGLLAHRFEYVTSYNVINSIIQVTIDDFIDEYGNQLGDNEFRASFHFNYLDAKDLREKLSEKQHKAFIIDSVSGLCGFVIAREVLITCEEKEDERTAQVQRTPSGAATVVGQTDTWH